MFNMKNTIQIAILCFGTQFKILIFVLVCDKARTVQNFVDFIKQITPDSNRAMSD